MISILITLPGSGMTLSNPKRSFRNVLVIPFALILMFKFGRILGFPLFLALLLPDHILLTFLTLSEIFLMKGALLEIMIF